jgi:hypothetical protein
MFQAIGVSSSLVTMIVRAMIARFFKLWVDEYLLYFSRY